MRRKRQTSLTQQSVNNARFERVGAGERPCLCVCIYVGTCVFMHLCVCLCMRVCFCVCVRASICVHAPAVVCRNGDGGC